jgi:ribosomal-protein-alanine N-acetyltransferase
MQLADVPQVIAVEQAAYTMQWPQKAYEHELTANDLAHYFILRTTLHIDPATSDLVGMAGFWLLADEAHISTLAVHPQWHRQGLGEWLLVNIIEEAKILGAVVATLEVRPSNQAALALYQKYNFAQVGRRPRYYSDNNEDALILTSPPLTTLDYQTMLTQRKTAVIQRLAKIDVDKISQID